MKHSPQHWIVLHLEAPLMAFGAPAIASHRPTLPFPSLSAICGLVANALGLDRTPSNEFAALATSITIASRLERGSHVLADLQTARLSRTDSTWTTRGTPETRSGARATYRGSHILSKDYLQDSAFTACLALSPVNGAPGPERVLAAFLHPARTLYFGRRSCIPAAPIVTDPANAIVTAATAYDALRSVPGPDRAMAAEWPAYGPLGTTRNAVAMQLRADQPSPENLHIHGHRHVCSGMVTPVQPATAAK